ncbi:MAG: SBBP repeat-containing protein, partial [Bryobacterales bacterium]|nr:SBBP repeat-containing protein [Bryobacterales bacterium]
MRIFFLGLTMMCGVGMASSPTPFAEVGAFIEENGGQFPAPAMFGADAGGTTIGFGERIVYRNGASMLEMDLAGARLGLPAAEDRRSVKIHAYRGADARRWRKDLSAYTAVRYRAVYPGIDLLFHADSGEMEYDFVVAPQANPRAIRYRFREARRVWLDEAGDLQVQFANGEVLRHQRPVAYQTAGGKRREIPAYFQLRGDMVSFAVARYDRTLPLVIDPVLRFATVMQAPFSQIASDALSNSYVVSRLSISVIDIDLICWKFDAQGKLIYKVYLGGVGSEEPGRIAADGSGNLYVTGTSNSSDYPVNTSPCRGPNHDGILTKLGPTGVILASRCFGGARTETVAGIGIDSGAFLHVAGTTESNDFPTTSGAFQTQPRIPDAKIGFVTKFDAASLGVVTSTLVGGFGETTVNDMAVEPSGAVTLAGTAWQPGFRTTTGALLTSVPNVPLPTPLPFVSRLAAGAASLLYSTFLPVTLLNSFEKVRIGVDGAGQTVIAVNHFPDAVRLLKLNSAGSQLLFDRLLGNRSGASSLEVDTAGNLLMVASDTNSYALTAESLQGRRGDMVVLKFDPTATNVLYASAMTAAGAMAKFGPGSEILVAASLQGVAHPQRFPVTAGANSDAPDIAMPLGREFFGLYRIAAGSAACNPTMEISNLTVANAGATLTLGVNAAANCTWAASVWQNPGDWITLEGRSYGTGNGGFMFTAKPLLPSDPGRTALLSVSPTASVLLTQGQPPGCVLGPMNNGSTGGPAAIREIIFFLPDTCAWTVSSDAAWLRVVSAASGTGSGVIHVAMDANTSPDARGGNIRINGQAVTFTQSPCTYNFGGVTLDSRAAVQPLPVVADQGCPWTLSTNASWIRLNSASTAVQEGPSTVIVEVDENLTNAVRSANFTMAGRTFTVQQAANSCFPAATVTQSLFPSGGGNGTFTVTVPAACNALGTIAAPGTV